MSLAQRLRRYGLDVPGQRLETTYINDRLNRTRPGYLPGSRFVVTASHPAVLTSMNTPKEVTRVVQLARARKVAIFSGTPDPLPAGVLFDLSDAEYVPSAAPSSGPARTW